MSERDEVLALAQVYVDEQRAFEDLHGIGIDAEGMGARGSAWKLARALLSACDEIERLREALRIAPPHPTPEGRAIIADAIQTAPWPFRNAQEVRATLEELAICVLHGWTEPAFVRGKLHTRAVEIAHLVLGEEKR